MTFTWKDIEARRKVTPPEQWRRMEAHFRYGKSLGQIAAGESSRKSKSSVILSVGRGCIALFSGMADEWSLIEAHRNAATPEQWRRMEAHFRGGKSMAQVAADEGRPNTDPNRSHNTITLAIGRGCIAVLNSMLGRPVRIPTELRSARPPEAVREKDFTSDGAEAHALSQDTQAVGCDEVREASMPLPAEPVDAQPTCLEDNDDRLTVRLEPTHSIAVGMRVERGTGQTRDTGRVADIEGESALVSWDSGTRTPAPLAELTPLQVGGR